MSDPFLHRNYFSHISPLVYAVFLLFTLFGVNACTTDTKEKTADSSADHQPADTNSDSNDTQISDTDSEDSATSESTYEMLCDDYAVAVLDNGFEIQNNVWGYESSSFTGYTQCVFYDTVQPSVFGWEWHLDGESQYPSYPRVEFGWNPWNRESSGTDVLPRQIQTVSSLVVSFEKELQSDGLYNTAFDIWLTSSDEMYSDTIVGEIMMWLDGTQSPGAQLTDSDITIGAQTYDFYKNTTWNDFPYLTFVQKNDQWNGQIDIMPFISYLVANGHLSADAYIAELEFGNEIWSGNGTMVVKNIAVAIE